VTNLTFRNKTTPSLRLVLEAPRK